MNIHTQEAARAALRYIGHYHDRGLTHGNMIEYKLVIRHMNKIYHMDERGVVKCNGSSKKSSH